MMPPGARHCTTSLVQPRRLSKPTFLQRPSLLTEPESHTQSAPDQSPSFPSNTYDVLFFQQVRKIIAARQSLDEIWPRSPHSGTKLDNNESSGTQAYFRRRQCAWNDWKMNVTDLLRMEETKTGQTKPGVRDSTYHTHIRQLIRVIRRRVEHDAASDSPQLTLDENREINTEISRFKDVDKCFPNCGHWNDRHGRHGRFNCQKCSRFT